MFYRVLPNIFGGFETDWYYSKGKQLALSQSLHRISSRSTDQDLANYDICNDVSCKSFLHYSSDSIRSYSPAVLLGGETAK